MNKDILIYSIGSSKSCLYAVSHLEKNGLSITDHPTPDATHLLVDIPSFSSENTALSALCTLPEDITVIGGGFSNHFRSKYSCVDLLTDPLFLMQNAAITAECALQVGAEHMERCWRGSRVLLLGWGRISRNLAALLASMKAECWIYSRSEDHLAQIQVMGYHPLRTVPSSLQEFHVVFNTAPSLLIDEERSASASGVMIDLASQKGIAGRNVIYARGLPGLFAPQSAGELIAESVLRMIQEE